ncbi:replication initiation protein [Spiroplasma endosymbiont of Virgichneumon dumeticola]|uniref:replication initiation protein n=1 Tax=Spiroplasma endosymbiont of Virgichneumon dumeticola TaxID=3139323 RepID=UPI0035C93EF5
MIKGIPIITIVSLSYIIFSHIKPYEKNELTIKLLKLDFFNKLELKSKNRYPRYQKLIKGLVNKTFVELKNEQSQEVLGNVITASIWDDSSSFFEVDLNHRFMPFLELWKDKFTKVDLFNILSFQSKYSLTLYK